MDHSTGDLKTKPSGEYIPFGGLADGGRGPLRGRNGSGYSLPCTIACATSLPKDRPKNIPGGKLLDSKLIELSSIRNQSG
jgi:hypothetical protein